MAYTRIHAIKATVNKSIAYICSPDKTDGELYISSFGCSAKTAHHEFAFANGKNIKTGDILAHHLIQSFSPGEVDFDTAHEVGIELADKFLDGKYSYVLATHVEKNHVHNHIIFCATDNIEHHKYNACKRSYNNIRKISDELCNEHHLSVIIPGEQRGKKRAEWEAGQEGTSWKDILRNDIDSTIKLAKSYDEFIALLKQKGYEIKGEQLNGTLKYISFRPAGKERFVRGSAKSLGSDYTREKINARIEQPVSERSGAISRTPPQNRTFRPRDYSKRNLIDTSSDKYTESAGLKRWAEIENLKTAASTYAQVQSISALKEQISEKRTASQNARSELVSLEHKMKPHAELLKYAEQYAENKPYHFRYRKSKNPDAYLRSHESQLILYDGAKNVLRKSGINLKSLDVDKMRSEYRRMSDTRKELRNSQKALDREVADLEKKLQTLNAYLGQEPSEHQQAKQPAHRRGNER
jgi:hypothetical protein